MPQITINEKIPSKIDPCLKNLTQNFGKLAESQTKSISDITKPHVESFNWFITDGLKLIPKSITPVNVQIHDLRLQFKIASLTLEKPKVPDIKQAYGNFHVYPSESRQRHSSYCGRLSIGMEYYINGLKQGMVTDANHLIPIMVKSKLCNLYGMTPEQLVKHHEEAEEMGGYYICNGNEKCCRMLVLQRRNYPLAITRNSWKNRGANYTEYGIMYRSVTNALKSVNLTLHYLKNGTIELCIFLNKEVFFLPLMMILKCLVDKPDIEIYNEMIKTKEDDPRFLGSIQTMLRQVQGYKLTTQKDFLNFLGEKFRLKLFQPSYITDAELGSMFIYELILINLDNNDDKFKLLCMMTRKLFDVASCKYMPDNADSAQHQEVLLSGHLYHMVLREKLESWLITMTMALKKIIESSNSTNKYTMISVLEIQKAMKKGLSITSAMSYFLATGNVLANHKLCLMQSSGFAIIAEKLNFMRYISHFRCLHRGTFFAEMRTTTVRKLLPEQFGFTCPVHTPDGTPCGLMNHISFLAEVCTHSIPGKENIMHILYNLGMVDTNTSIRPMSNYYFVYLDGVIVGWLEKDLSEKVTNTLRYKKAKAIDGVPAELEICLVKEIGKPGQYPGVYLFLESARLLRPVLNLTTNSVEMIGAYEQVYMNICIVKEEANELTTHQELCQHSCLSTVASFTPYSDFNQSPRNMYQCQMGKQTMGTCSQALNYRADNKLYRIQTPQSPLVRPYLYDHYKMDNFPYGTNAVVAVISYTGYDMEDAMILNKSSFERGFAHGSIYKCDFVNLMEKDRRAASTVRFGTVPNNSICQSLLQEGKLQQDGLPPIGHKLVTGEPYYSYVDSVTNQFTVKKYSGETAFVQQIRAVSNDNGTGHFNKVAFVLRIPRNPIIGDKFASRHGQKGICSQKWPVENIPFTESGMYPDIVFNPHGFPSRMTIGMMIESMAGKAAAMHGEPYDATPFRFSEDVGAVEHFGDCLRKAGFNYFGTERMYSGVSGEELEADIFIGIVYYQRLRHMVSDKFQVRTTGKSHLF